MSDPRVVWILCSNRWNSAITEYALSAARALKLNGWSVFFSALQDSPAEQRARAYDLPGDSFAHFGMTEVGRLRRIRRRIRPEAVLLFGGPETFLARFLAGMLRIRFRGQDKDMVGPLVGWKNRLNMQPCAAVLVPARGLEARFRPIWFKGLRTVALGIDTHKFAFQADALVQPRRPTLRIVGRLDPIKGHAAFFALFRQLLRGWPADQAAPFLEVIGQPANISAEQLRAAAVSAELREGEDWSLCTERVQDIAARMTATDVGVIPSLGSEVICRVAEEFLVCGVPLFVSGVGALAESLVEKGFGVSYRDLQEADAVVALRDLLQESIREKEGQRAARAAAAVGYFSLERMGRELTLMLDELLTPAGSGD